MNREGFLLGLLHIFILISGCSVAQTSDDQLVRELEAKLCQTSNQPEDIASEGDMAVLRKIQADRQAELKKWGTRGLDALLKMAQSKDLEVQSCAFVYLVQMHDTRVAPLLRRIASQNSYPKAFRISAITQLGRLRDSGSTGLLEGFLQANDPDFVRTSIQGLGYIGNNEAKTALRSVLADPKHDASLNSLVAFALGKARDNVAIPQLSELAQQQTSRYQLEPYLTALAEIGTPEALSTVSKLIDASSGDRRALVFSIYGHLIADKNESTDSRDGARIQQSIDALCSHQKGMCPE